MFENTSSAVQQLLDAMEDAQRGDTVEPDESADFEPTPKDRLNLNRYERSAWRELRQQAELLVEVMDQMDEDGDHYDD